MDFSIASILALDGVTNGAVYALLALATVLLFTITRVIFIPQGEFVAFGALTLAMLQTGQVPGTVWFLVILAILAAGGEFIAMVRQGRGAAKAAVEAGKILAYPLAVSLLAWWAEQRDEDLFISALTIAEIRRGILEKPRGKKRDALDAWFSGPEGPQELFAGRILSFDDKAGLIWARLMAEGKVAGRPRSALDMIIAAVAGANDCVVVTDNEKDFRGLQIVNPLRRGAKGGEI